MKESRILFDCSLSSETYGIVSIEFPIRRYIVYSQPINELVGFRTLQKVITIGDSTYIEVGTFFDLLFECDYTAWKILTHPSPDMKELEEFYEGYQDMVCVKLIRTFYEDSKKNIKKINEKLAGYGKEAYLCGEKLMVAESLILSKQFKISRVQLLQNVLDCKLHDSSVKKEYRSISKVIDSHIQTCDFSLDFDRNYFNSSLLKLRTYDSLHRQ